MRIDLRWWTVRYAIAIAVLSTGCLGKPTRPGGDACGNGSLDVGEACDDGGRADGDGCSTSCSIEPWFECPVAGERCHPVLALQWTAPGTDLPNLGGTGGTAFDEDCGALPGLDGPSSVIVGFRGTTSINDDSLASLSAACASIEIRPGGSIHWMNPMLTQEQGNSPSAAQPDVRLCDADEVATGLDARAGNLVSGFEVICQAVTHTNGVLAFGTPRKLPLLGLMIDTAQPRAQCAPNAVMRAMIGRSGAAIDQLSATCVDTSEVVCGDGVVTDPETCDDGNAEPGDGCNETCSGD